MNNIMDICVLSVGLTITCLTPIFLHKMLKKIKEFKNPKINLSYCSISVRINILTGCMLVLLNLYAILQVCVIIVPVMFENGI